MIIAIFAKSLRNMLIPEIMRLFLLCLLAYALGWWVLAWIVSSVLSALAGISGGEGFVVHVLGSAGGMVIAWFLFPLLYPILVNFFDDKMAEVIEHEDYPQLPPAQPPFWPTILQDALFSLKAIGLNILFMPLYFMPLVGIFIYYGLNGHLLGTQFFRMVAGRRIKEEEATTLHKTARTYIFLIGISISFSATIPFVNLIAPLLGVASMLHLFHALRGTDKQQIIPPS
jgi:uncharacterized protein involved in cysteine biosynthesis